MNIFVDTSVWSLALRRSPPPRDPAVILLEECLGRGETIVTTGLVIQELLQGFQGPASAQRIIKRFSLLPAIIPELEDHIAAAALRNQCRRRGLQIGTIDALLAQLCLRHHLHLLTTDKDFHAISRHAPLSLLLPP